jgi:pyrroloquinoline quinone biosynthesis protein E
VSAAWYDSDGFNRFRGTGWMKEPCASCDEREKDFGGCRCQAYLLANDPYAADPVCDKSPQHAVVTAAVEQAQQPRVREHPLVFRDPANSRQRSAEPMTNLR